MVVEVVVMIKVTSIFKGKSQEEIEKAFNEKFLEHIVYKLKTDKNIELITNKKVEKKN